MLPSATSKSQTAIDVNTTASNNDSRCQKLSSLRFDNKAKCRDSRLQNFKHYVRMIIIELESNPKTCLYEIPISESVKAS